MYFTKHPLIFLLIAILFEYCQAVREDSNNIYPKAEDTESLPILPPINAGKKTYYVETFFKANWYRAEQFCRYNGKHLASINNQEENDILVEELIKAYGLGLTFWTSGNDLAVNGSYFWLSNGANFQYKNWHRGEPNHDIINNEEEHCVELFLSNESNETLKWYDVRCSNKLYMICETWRS